MPQNITAIPEALGPVSVPSTGDPRDSGPIRAAFQKMLNMIAGASQAATPAGAVLGYAGPVAPVGWLLCNGQAVSRTNYAALYAALGTLHGPGDGSTTFNLPDMRGRVAVGTGQGQGLSNRTLGQLSGEETHSLTLQELPKHTHNIPTKAGTGPVTGGTYELPDTAYNDLDYVYTAPTSETGGNGAHNNMPPFLALNYIIRTGL